MKSVAHWMMTLVLAAGSVLPPQLVFAAESDVPPPPASRKKIPSRTDFGIGVKPVSRQSTPPDTQPAIPMTEVEAARLRQPTPPTDTPPILPETQVEAAPLEGTQAREELENFTPQANDPIVTGTEFNSPLVEGYRANSSTAGTLFDIPDGDFPGTVNVVPHDLFTDQQVLQFEDLTRDSGATNFGGDDPFFLDRIFLRGMQLSSRDFRKDGFLDPTYVPRDFQNVERVEILKGPPSVLYGASSPAGMVNVVTKKPLEARFATGGFMFGSFDRQRYLFDVNTMNAAGDVRIRVNGAQEDANSYRDFGYLARTAISPGIAWQISDSSRLTYLGEWHKDDRLADSGFPLMNSNPLFLPYNRNTGQPFNSYLQTEEVRNTLMFEHEYQNGWTWKIGGNSLFYRYPNDMSFASDLSFLGLVNAPPLFYQSRSTLSGNDQTQSMVTNLSGETMGLLFNHHFLAGMEYIYFDSDSQVNLNPNFVPINVLAPTYLPSNTPPSPPTLVSVDTGAFRQQRVGFYLQDLAELTSQLKLLSGVRFDLVDFTYNRTINLLGFPPITALTQQNFDRVTPRVGMIYQPLETDELSFYFNYSQSFAPPAGGIYLTTTGLQPVTGSGWEGGVKTQLLDNLSLNAAGFYNMRRNADFLNSDQFLVQLGAERARGCEINLLGQLTDRWSTVANYAYVDSRLYDDSIAAFNGQHQRGVPFNTGNIWTRYNLIDNDEHTFGAALGLVTLSRRPGDLANTFQLPGFARWDSGLFYKRGRATAMMYAENIFDTYYAAGSIDQYQIMPAAPANIRATISLTY